ncbi:MAG: hypothetical protein IIV81_01555, partial [Clostridia bacterium]|nr:hypothetical protein [Clostridia bacterium]
MGIIRETEKSIILENNRAEIHLSKKNSIVEKVIDKKTGNDIRGEETRFLDLIAEDSTPVEGYEISLAGSVITVKVSDGSFNVDVKVYDNYFALEITSALPQSIAKVCLAHIKYNYDYTDKNNTGAVVIPLTVLVDPVEFPDGKNCETVGRVLRKIGDVGAKAALVIAPLVDHAEILKEASLTIDKEKGIVSKMGGALALESRLPYTNYTIVTESSKEWLRDNLDFFKFLGVDQIDFHKGAYTFRQGDFKFMCYESAADFKKNVVDVLEANGMSAGLHTYSCYINYDVDKYLSKPEYQKQLKSMGDYTLAEDLREDATDIKIEEDFTLIPTDRGFCKNNSPFFLIDEELVKFAILPNGLKVTERGCGGSKIASHKKGAAAIHIEGHYGGLMPKLGSDLFYEIARETARVYNEGGFKMIYLDALDGISHHCPKEESAFWAASFVNEVLKNCKIHPIMEAGGYWPSMWASRGRTGVLDTPYRGYKLWNKYHNERNIMFTDRHHATSLGWYNFYPMTDN